ncbi:MAG: phosphate ABC transporter substrate-binding protein [Nitrospiraceae bacterium]|nr:MAG: phosphate ABC transporter substrate-binding protein [Nitrospiraceae bacterium]
MKTKLIFFSGLSLVFLSIFFLNIPPAVPETLTGSGCSVSNMGYLSELVQDYEKITGVKIYVRGGGSLVGIEDLRSGNVDFAASCRHKMHGDPENVEFIQVAWDALVFIVNKSNPVDNISLEEARAIYSGKVNNWGQIKGGDAPINVFISRSQKTNGLSGVESSTKEMVLDGKDPVETPNTVFLASTAIVEQMVEKTSGGFAATGFSSARKRDVKMLKLNGVYPDKKNISSNSYPLKRPLYLLVPKEAGAETKNFIDFVLSKKGQKLISSYGAISLLDIK